LCLNDNDKNSLFETGESKIADCIWELKKTATYGNGLYSLDAYYYASTANANLIILLQIYNRNHKKYRQ